MALIMLKAPLLNMFCPHSMGKALALTYSYIYFVRVHLIHILGLNFEASITIKLAKFVSMSTQNNKFVSLKGQNNNIPAQGKYIYIYQKNLKYESSFC